MHERDWYLKEIEKLSKLLAKLLMLRKEGQLAKALEIIHEKYQELVDTSPQELDGLTEAEIVALVQRKGLAPHQLQVLAQLLIQEGEILADQQATVQSRSLFHKAITVLNHLTVTEKTFSFEREEVIRQLQQKLA